MQSILVTGGAGFIGSHFIRYLFSRDDFRGRVINIDKLTYAGNVEYLQPVEISFGGERYFFIQGDICDETAVRDLFCEYGIDTVVNFAAETHVDTSIRRCSDFITTNILGTATLLEAASEAWEERDDVLFHQVSTDEVFGTLGETGKFSEATCYRPRNPYSATKASADHMVLAFSNTFRLPYTISYSSNNYGPNQHGEKLIPTMIRCMFNGEKLPIYGDGLQVREWLYVGDHVEAIWKIMTGASAGSSYAIGSGMEVKNLDLVQLLCSIMADEAGMSRIRLLKQLAFVPDRPGHDRRYALDFSRIRSELGWRPNTDFEDGLRETVRWYVGRAD